MHIDMERDRALLGLPPKAPLLPGPLKVFFAALLVLALISLLGGVLRLVINHQEESGLNKLYRQMRHEQDVAIFRQLLVRIRELAPNTSEGRGQTAKVLEYAAGRLPEQMLLRQEALLNYRAALALASSEARQSSEATLTQEALMRMAVCGLLLELGQDREAKAEAENLHAQYSSQEFWSELEDNYTNLLAYVLASAKDPAVRDAAEARRLMDPLMTSSDFARRIPAYLDTWAECFHASDDSRRAVEVQKEALAAASGQDLYVYIDHFRRYKAAAEKLPAPAAEEGTPQPAATKP